MILAHYSFFFKLKRFVIFILHFLCLVMKYRVKPILQRLVEGNAAKFHCASSTPVYWDYDGTDATTTFIKKRNISSFKIKKVSKRHTRFYLCEGTDSATGKYFRAWGSLVVLPRKGII